LPESGPPEPLEPTKLDPPNPELLAASRPPRAAKEQIPSDAPTVEMPAETPLPSRQPPEDESTFVSPPSRELRQLARPPERPPRSRDDAPRVAATQPRKAPAANDLVPEDPLPNNLVPPEETLVRAPPPALLREIRRSRPARPEVVTLDEADLDEGWEEDT
jgi:hypothetical protein